MSWYGRSRNNEIPMPDRALGLRMVSVIYDGPVLVRAPVVWRARFRMLSGTLFNELEIGLVLLNSDVGFQIGRYNPRNVVTNQRLQFGGAGIFELEPGDTFLLFAGVSTLGNMVLAQDGLDVVVL